MVIKMICILQNRNDFEHEVQALARAFFKKEVIQTKLDSQKEDQLIVRLELQKETITICIEQEQKILWETKEDAQLQRRREYKNKLKRMLYEGFLSITKSTLPWGTLTGVRPTKLLLEKLEEGWSEKEIIAHIEQEYLCSPVKSHLSMEIAKREFQILQKIDYKNSYSLYIGIPFCPSRCLYCSFTSYPLEQYECYIEQYLAALFREIDYAVTCFPNKKLVSIYIGGGTPTTLSANQLERLITKIKQTFPMEFLAEFTVEAGRPDSISYEKLVVLKQMGITRISINPQSMQQKTLDFIGRAHTIQQVIDAFYMARKAGHDNINMDLIVGLPKETADDIEQTLTEVKKLNPESLTVHTLAIKRAANLNIYKEKYESLIPAYTSAMLDLTTSYAKAEGYFPYYLYRQKNMSDNLENVGYAKPGRECIYNILIMEEKQTILALGAGASSKFVFPTQGRLERVENVKSVTDYIGRIDEMILRKKEFLNREKGIYHD